MYDAVQTTKEEQSALVDTAIRRLDVSPFLGRLFDAPNAIPSANVLFTTRFPNGIPLTERNRRKSKLEALNW